VAPHVLGPPGVGVGGGSGWGGTPGWEGRRVSFGLGFGLGFMLGFKLSFKLKEMGVRDSITVAYTSKKSASTKSWIPPACLPDFTITPLCQALERIPSQHFKAPQGSKVLSPEKG
jgi:hypothetical protein